MKNLSALYPLLFSYILGLIIGYFKLSLISFISFPLFIFLFLFLLYKKSLSLVILTALFSLLGFFLINYTMNPKGKEKILLEMSNTKRVTLEGIVKKYLSRKKGGIIVLNVKKILLPEREVDVKGNVRITIRYSKADFKKGDRVLMSPDLFLPKNFNNPGRFDYVRYLAQKGIHITGVINSSRDILILEKGCLSPPILLIEEIREKIKEALIHSFGNSPSEALIETLLLGEKKRLSQNYIDIFNRAGVAHILAISGLHMGMIAFFFYFLFKLIQKISL
ncbi:MAG: ComEC family competence protein, partial [Deltaproteobacteria bacterium]|nr:ComEC family competence protein [Deltaproteobacteria bacterium]